MKYSFPLYPLSKKRCRASNYTHVCWESVFLVGRLADTTKQALGMLETLSIFSHQWVESGDDGRAGQDCIV